MVVKGIDHEASLHKLIPGCRGTLLLQAALCDGTKEIGCGYRIRSSTGAADEYFIVGDEKISPCFLTSIEQDRHSIEKSAMMVSYAKVVDQFAKIGELSMAERDIEAMGNIVLAVVCDRIYPS